MLTLWLPQSIYSPCSKYHPGSFTAGVGPLRNKSPEKCECQNCSANSKHSGSEYRYVQVSVDATAILVLARYNEPAKCCGVTQRIHTRQPRSLSSNRRSAGNAANRSTRLIMLRMSCEFENSFMKLDECGCSADYFRWEKIA